MTDDIQDIDLLFEQAAMNGANPEQLPASEKEALDAPPVSMALYDRLGGVVRQLHDALRVLGYEHVLDETLREITDSQDRLQYIASLTEQAANRVLNAVDESLPIQTEQAAQAKQMENAWVELLASGVNDVDGFKHLAQQSQQFLATVAVNSEDEKKRLMDIMMAQDFQDITGQIIKKVVTLTQRLESDLTQILVEYAPAESRTEKPVDLLAGPAVPDQAMVQDDVDSMLADLGF